MSSKDHYQKEEMFGNQAVKPNPADILYCLVEIISSREEMFGNQAAKPNPADILYCLVEIISSREEMFGNQAAKPNPADSLRQKKAAYVEVSQYQ
jgi:hypothetical protein